MASQTMMERKPTEPRQDALPPPLLISVGTGEPVAVSQELEGTTRADVQLRVGFAELRVKGGTNPSLLASGTVQTPRGEHVRQAFRIDGETAVLCMKSVRKPRSDGHVRIWDLTLSDKVPLALTIDTGLGDATLDLSALQLTTLDLHSGVGDTTLTLPALGRYEANVVRGVGDTTIRIPAGVAARIDVARTLGAVTVPADFAREGKRYISPNYANATSRAELRVRGGIGDITIERDR